MSALPGFPHFSNAFSQAFSRSKLRFSRTIICGKKDSMKIQIMPKILNSNFTCTFKKIQRLSGTFSIFSFFKDFSRAGNLFIHFPGFPGFPGCVGTLLTILYLKVS